MLLLQFLTTPYPCVCTLLLLIVFRMWFLELILIVKDWETVRCCLETFVYYPRMCCCFGHWLLKFESKLFCQTVARLYCIFVHLPMLRILCCLLIGIWILDACRVYLSVACVLSPSAWWFDCRWLPKDVIVSGLQLNMYILVLFVSSVMWTSNMCMSR